MSLLADLDRSLAALASDDRDLAARNLARLLAAQIDADPALTKDLAPKLTTLLRALGLTPDSRKGVQHGAAADEGEGELAEVVELYPAG